jgi:hypothetical protein
MLQAVIGEVACNISVRRPVCLALRQDTALMTMFFIMAALPRVWVYALLRGRSTARIKLGNRPRVGGS